MNSEVRLGKQRRLAKYLQPHLAELQPSSIQRGLGSKESAGGWPYCTCGLADRLDEA